MRRTGDVLVAIGVWFINNGLKLNPQSPPVRFDDTDEDWPITGDNPL